MSKECTQDSRECASNHSTATDLGIMHHPKSMGSGTFGMQLNSRAGDPESHSLKTKASPVRRLLRLSVSPAEIES
jgi:hypothetical protein